MWEKGEKEENQSCYGSQVDTHSYVLELLEQNPLNSVTVDNMSQNKQENKLEWAAILLHSITSQIKPKIALKKTKKQYEILLFV